jgi:deoxyadenosine/deoxycytidine kinase
MGKLVTIVGNLGVGKTTLMQKLVHAMDLEPYWENPEARPFQKRFYAEPKRWALANQVDFLLYRGEQEAAIRANPRNGMMDGGLDQDFYIFTRHLNAAGILAEDEYTLCRRTYSLMRTALPAPEVVVYLRAPLSLLLERREQRGRILDQSFMTPEQLFTLETYFTEWLFGGWHTPVITVESNVTDDYYEAFLPEVVARLKGILE